MKSRVILAMAITAALASPICAAETGYIDPTDYLGQVEVPEGNKVYNSQAFQDNLDLPSAKSSLAAKSLINGFALAGHRLVAVGDRGHILYSDDQGKSWIQANVPVSSVLTAVYFPSPQKGWAVGQDGVVLHSADGGATWIKQFDGRAAAQVMMSYYTDHPANGVMETIQRFVADGPDKPFLDVWFENDSTGFIVGAFNLIFQTTDGGKSWIPLFHQTDNTNQYHLFAIHPIAQELYISGERGLVLKLDRKTGQFRKVNIPYNGTLFGITGKAGTMAAFGLRGNLFISRNGGGSWQKVSTGTEAGLTSGTVTEDGRIVVVSALGQVFVSSDNGASFNLIMPKQPQPASAVAALGKDTLVLGGLFGTQVVPLK